ncbi:MAG: family 20 glycosylhydrolase, partial [Chitinophagaceae bacterium]|nr:family 20 glycosylhydrolase [Chitinophagaceae bacterium]
MSAISIIPQPVSLQAGTGSFQLAKTTVIEVIAANPEVKKVADSLSKKLSNATGFNLSVVPGNTPSGNPGTISFSLINDAAIGKEGYKLDVTPDAVKISANAPAGLFYGMQTLLQLLPKEIEGKKTATNITWTIPACSITDYPRFGWRGLMFDVSRHFFTKNEVKQFIDDMVKYKYNLLHWHLTDDEGWRIEIKSLPKLTEVGAWRPKRKGKWADTANPP